MKFPPPNIEWWESKEDTQLSVVRTEFHFSALHYGDYVLWGAELWFVVCGCVLVREIEGAPKIFRKLLRRRNHSIAVEISRSGPITTVIFF